jgi:hypothetical protein
VCITQVHLQVQALVTATDADGRLSLAVLTQKEQIVAAFMYE